MKITFKKSEMDATLKMMEVMFPEYASEIIKEYEEMIHDEKIIARMNRGSKGMMTLIIEEDDSLTVDYDEKYMVESINIMQKYAVPLRGIVDTIITIGKNLKWVYEYIVNDFFKLFEKTMKENQEEQEEETKETIIEENEEDYEI